MFIRPEQPADVAEIRNLVSAAFSNASHSSGNEAQIVDSLRRAGALAASIVAEDGGDIVGYVAFSPVRIAERDERWYGLGPVAVRADRRRVGIGKDLIEAGLRRIAALGAKGCVVLGDPAYYARFGFACDPNLILEGVPAAYFQRLVIDGAAPRGIVQYHPSFFA